MAPFVSRRSTASDPELRFALGASWWPGGGALGVALGAAYGPALHIDQPHLQGTLNDYTAAVLGRLRHDLAEVVRLTTATGLTTDITVLEGTAVALSRARVDALRVVPSVRLELGADWLFTPWLRLGLHASGSWLLRTQRYLVNAEPVLELSRRHYEVTLVLGVSLPRARTKTASISAPVRL